jgi:ABC-type lipoprotein release transport system permease subunit
VDAFDVPVFAVVTLLVVLVVLITTGIAGRRALSIDPAEALRAS